MPEQPLDLLSPFITTGIATFVLLYYFLRPEHYKLRTEQILLFWFLSAAVFFFVEYIPSYIRIPFVYFLIQAVAVYLLLRNYWKVKDKEVLKLTFIFVLVNAAGILILGYLLKGIV